MDSFFLDLIMANAMRVTMIYPIRDITDDSIPNSPPVIANDLLSRIYENNELEFASSPIYKNPKLRVFQSACTIPLFQTEPLSIAIMENMIPTKVPATITNKQLPIEKSAPMI